MIVFHKSVEERNSEKNGAKKRNIFLYSSKILKYPLSYALASRYDGASLA
jgi:hypothetical protein